MPTSPSPHSPHIRLSDSGPQSKLSSISNNEIEIHKPKFKLSTPPPRLHLLNKGENNFIPIDSKPHTTKGNLTDLYERLRKYYLRENKKSTSKKKFRFADDDSSMFDNVNVVIPGKYISGECIKKYFLIYFSVSGVFRPQSGGNSVTQCKKDSSTGGVRSVTFSSQSNVVTFST